MTTFREKFYNLHQELANCRSELVILRLHIGNERHNKQIESSHLLKEEKRLILREDELTQKLKQLSSSPSDYC